MAKKQKAKPLVEMTPEEQAVELAKYRREEEARDARRKLLRDTGFYDWSGQLGSDNHGDTWIAAYGKALEDAAQTVEGLDTPSPELQDVIAAAIREILK